MLHIPQSIVRSLRFRICDLLRKMLLPCPSLILHNKQQLFAEEINPSKKFNYIKRRIDVEVAESLKSENLSGIFLEDDQKREYPYGRVAGQIIGACNIDGDGLCGIELYYDDILRGSTGKTVRQQGMKGMPIPGGTLQETAVIDGQDIMLTIDIELQQKVENYLEE